MNKALADFENTAAWLISMMVKDFEFTPTQASGFPGNGYQESMLRAILENDGIVTSATRGIGWFQWTGPRHRAAVAFWALWCPAHKLDWHTREAQYAFTVHELKSDYAHVVVKLRETNTIAGAVSCVEHYYEGAGIVQMQHREAGAEIALAAYRRLPKPAPAQPEPRPASPAVPIPQAAKTGV